MFIKASDNETETFKQVESPGVNGNPEDVSKENARAGQSKFSSGFFPCGERNETEEEQHTI